MGDGLAGIALGYRRNEVLPGADGRVRGDRFLCRGFLAVFCAAGLMGGLVRISDFFRISAFEFRTLETTLSSRVSRVSALCRCLRFFLE